MFLFDKMSKVAGWTKNEWVIVTNSSAEKKMKVLVTGASGLLGRQIMTTLRAEDVPCLGLCYSRTSESLTSLDLTDLAATREFIMAQSPSHVIHAAAQRFPDKVQANPEAAVKLNVESSRNIAVACRDIGARMIYISTDYVFDGNHPPYFPDNKTNPLNMYGETKLAGEEAVLAVDEKFLVLRIPVLYGGVTRLEESAVSVLLEVIRNKEVPAKISSYEVRCPSHTGDIANILLDLIRLSPSPPGRVFHWCGREKFSKWEMCRLISQELGGLDISHLQEVKGAGGTPRPRDVELDRSNLELLGISHHTDFRCGIREELNRFV